MTAPVIFLDIDGPMIPGRAYALRTQTRRPPPFDPIAVAMVSRLCQESGAEIVISSTWRKRRSRDEMTDVLRQNGLGDVALHEDWGTPVLDSQTRGQQITAWLRNHPMVERYVALDDDHTVRTLPGAVLCTSGDGIGLEQYNRARELLGLKPVVVAI